MGDCDWVILRNSTNHQNGYSLWVIGSYPPLKTLKDLIELFLAANPSGLPGNGHYGVRTCYIH